MATIKVKLKKSSSNNRIGFIYYQVIHNRKAKQIASNLPISKTYWDNGKEQIISTDSYSLLIKNIIESDLTMFGMVESKLSLSGNKYTIPDIIEQFEIIRHRPTLKEFIHAEVSSLIQYGKYGTARNYIKTLNSINTYLQGIDIHLYSITENLIDGYNAYLHHRGIMRNSVSFYMRILRAIYNKAARQHLVEHSNPFAKVYTGIDSTRKRAVDEKIIMNLSNLDLSKMESLSLARDLFLFSYCTRGMSFVDMAYLKWSNVKGNDIIYIRHKTKQQLKIRIEPQIHGIIAKYASISTYPYLLPILTTADPHKAFIQYQSALNYYNKLLKKISFMLKLDSSLSSYTARHSWASVARNYNIPLSVISAGMGHTSDKTTLIYLTSLENASIDMANHKIISMLGKPTAIRAANFYRMP